MKTILFMAISVDGKTTGSDEDVSWVNDADIERMDKLMVKSGVMIMGSNTYYSFGDDLPNESALQVVMTSNSELLNKKMDNVIFTDQKPKEVLQMLAEKGFNQVMLAGGEKLNSSFLAENLIDEIWLIRKPIILGNGKSLFSGEFDKKLELVEDKELEDGGLELKYRVSKSD